MMGETLWSWGRRWFSQIDWWLLAPALLLVGAGLITMDSFVGESYFFNRQLWWLAVSLAIFLSASLVDWRFLRQSGVLVVLFFLACLALLALMAFGQTTRGAQSWFTLAGVSFQPSDFIKLVLILLLAKYFSRRHVEIAHYRHILISGVYAFIPFLLVFFQPDFGSAVIIFLIWFGMIVFSGISKRHLFGLLSLCIVAFSVLWLGVFAPYQKARILSFVHPLADTRGVGYSSFQSTIAIGSGQWWGKGVGYGTQSRLRFLPEYETDFIFAAFAEEWGFVGVVVMFGLFGLIFWRLIRAAMFGATNFETLFAVGLLVLLVSHFIISVGMNLGLLPVTGLPLPLVSYGGSHLLAEFLGLGILTGMNRYARSYHRDDMSNEFLGVA